MADIRRLRAPGLCLALALAMACAPAGAREAAPVAANPELEARMMTLAGELRCLVCQNQTIADSHSDLAEDLRRQIREMLARGMDESQIRVYMTDRYGDFVLYKPPFKWSTALLWLGPPALLLLGLAVLWRQLRARERLGDDAFDPETFDAHDSDPQA